MSVDCRALVTAANRGTAIAISNGEMGFIRPMTTNLATAELPATHYAASGPISQAAYDALVAASAANPTDYKVSTQPWLQVCADWGVTPVVIVE